MSLAVLLQMVLFSALFYLLYHTVLRASVAHHYHRIFLLLVPVWSVLIPLVMPYWPVPSTYSSTFIPALDVTYALPEVELQAGHSGSSLPVWWIAYGVGAVLYAIIPIRSLIHTFRLLRTAEKDSAARLYFSPQCRSAFSFLGWVIIHLSVKGTSAQKAIVLHEKAHQQLGHSYDLLFYEFFKIVFWFNPFWHLLQKQLAAVHEFQADAVTARKIGAQKYACALLNTAFQTQLFSTGLSSYFNRSLIKTRIAMLTQTSAPKNGARYLWVAPLCALMMALSCQKENAQTGSSASNPADAELNKPEEDPAGKSSSSSQPAALNEVERVPIYEGCSPQAVKQDAAMCFQKSILEHISAHFKYPEVARKAQIKGRIYLEFVINTEGLPQDIKILRGQYSDSTATEAIRLLEKEAKRVVMAIPKAKEPALQKEQPVGMKFIVPISLKIS